MGVLGSLDTTAVSILVSAAGRCGSCCADSRAASTRELTGPAQVVLYWLARSPACAAKLYAEIDSKAKGAPLRRPCSCLSE